MATSTLRIESRNLHWLDGIDPAEDLCAHGGVVIRCGEQELVDDPDGVWTLSAAGLHLLRTLERSHSSDSPVAGQLFPCCGFSIYAAETPDGDVDIVGCPNGIDGEVGHEGSQVRIRFGEASASVDRDAWEAAVMEFCQSVRSFYDRSEPKRPSEDDAAGYSAFWAEWEKRMSAIDSRSSNESQQIGGEPPVAE